MYANTPNDRPLAWTELPTFTPGLSDSQISHSSTGPNFCVVCPIEAKE
jgi:hypothetical protein